MTDHCATCSNAVGNFCTMQKDMSKTKFKQCDCFKILPKKIIKVRTVKRVVELDDKYDVSSSFKRFLDKGGHWNFNK